MSDPMRIRAQVQGDKTTVRVLVSHEMESGQRKDAAGKIAIKIPADMGDGGIRTKHFVGRPARPETIKGNVQGKVYQQYDFTPQQYASLIRL